MSGIIKDKQKFGRMLRQRREEKGLTQDQLAEMVGVGFTAISKMEKGHIGPGEDTLKKLCEVLDLPIEDLSPVTYEEKLMDAVESIRRDLALYTEKSTEQIKSVSRDLHAILSALATSGAKMFPDWTEEDQQKIKTMLSRSEAELKEYDMKAGGGKKRPEEPKEGVVDLEKVAVDLLKKYEGAGSDIGFIDSLLDTRKKRELKDRVFVDAFKLTETLDLDPYKEVSTGSFDIAEGALVDALTRIVFDFACDTEADIDEAGKELVDLLSKHSEQDTEENEDDREEKENDDWW